MRRISRSTITPATTESTQMFKLICYQLVVLRLTLYFGLVVSSKRSKPMRCNYTRTDTIHTNDSRSTSRRESRNRHLNTSTRYTRSHSHGTELTVTCGPNTFVRRKVARTEQNLSGSPSYAGRSPLVCTVVRGRC